MSFARVWKPDVSTGGNSNMTFPLNFGGRNCTLWMSRLSKSRFLKTFLAPFEPWLLFKESTILRDFWLPTWDVGRFNGIGDLWLDSGSEQLTNGDLIGNATAGEFPSESSLRIVINSSASLEENPVQNDTKMSSSLCYERT
jgi:hypothetical protein